MKNFIHILLITSFILLGFTASVQAGQAFEYGRAGSSPYPPVGNVNWVAWLNKNVTSGHPDHILTEDSTNSGLMINGGYVNVAGNPGWLMEAENFDNEVNGDTITIRLGGLNADAGKLWETSFAWDQIAPGSSNHGQAPLVTGTPFCPSITTGNTSGTPPNVTQSINWSGPSGRYYVYRSTQASGLENGASNGLYYYQDTVMVTAPGTSGTYSQIYDGEAWYIVIPANGAGNTIDGCHSEEAQPTAVEVAGISATFNPLGPVTFLEWEAMPGLNILGFNVYRASEADGIRQKINSALLPYSFQQGPYHIEDTKIQRGKTYFYWIEVVKQGAEPTAYGPQKVTIDYCVFIPLWVVLK